VTFLLDADVVIKLNKAGALDLVLMTFQCAIPQAVYEEAVLEGKARGHGDAAEIAEALVDRCKVVDVIPAPPEPGLGNGELGLLAMLELEPGAVVVSDDRRLLALLAERAIPHMETAPLLAGVARDDPVKRGIVEAALRRLRPLVTVRSYWNALQILELSNGD
jgi:rRNA-processing protein FCF1